MGLVNTMKDERFPELLEDCVQNLTSQHADISLITQCFSRTTWQSISVPREKASTDPLPKTEKQILKGSIRSASNSPTCQERKKKKGQHLKKETQKAQSLNNLTHNDHPSTQGLLPVQRDRNM